MRRCKGYLTFNPLKYIDLRTSIIFPVVILLIGGIALPGGAVWVDRSRLRNDAWVSAMSLAGPAANLLLAFMMAIPFLLGLADADSGGWIWPALSVLAYLQVFCFLLNMIPIPPLDGFGAISHYLPRELQAKLYALSWPIMIGLLMIMIFSPVGGKLAQGTAEVVAFFGIPFEQLVRGFESSWILGRNR